MNNKFALRRRRAGLLPKQRNIATYWNNYLVFIPSYTNNNNNNNILSFLLIFDFANGKDSTNDI